MAPHKCCVGGCNATSDTHHLFIMPQDDNLRKLWMSFLVPTNPQLAGLTNQQLLRKRVCHQHFDRYQLNGQGRRNLYSYPCLFSAAEIAHRIPLSSEEYHVLAEHNYHQQQGETNIDAAAEASSTIINEGKHDEVSQPSRTAAAIPPTTYYDTDGMIQFEFTHTPRAALMKKGLSSKKRKFVVKIISRKSLKKSPTERRQESQNFRNFDTHGITYSTMSAKVCRVCLVDYKKMYSVRNDLHNVYERLTGEKYNKVGYPVHMCYICLTVLRKCHRFMETARDTNNVLKQWCNQQNEMIAARPLYTYSVSKVELVSSNDGDMSLQNDIKLEKMVSEQEEIQPECSENNTDVDIKQTDVDEQTDYSELRVHSPNDDTHIETMVKYEKISPHNNELPPLKKHKYNNNTPETSGETAATSETSNDTKRETPFRNTKKYSCGTCNYKTTVKRDIIRHKRSHIDAERRYICDICGIKFTQISSLNNHITSHTGVKSFSCNICGNAFARKGTLERHIKTHTRVKQFSSNICGNQYAEKGSLQKHITSHTGEKPAKYSCSICAFKSRFSHNFKVHMRIHTGEKPFVCDICGYQCAHRSDLKTHIRTHTGERPYSCTICDFKFNVKGNLIIHMRSHTGEKPFSCCICDRKFTQKRQLKIHMRTHTGEKPFSCHICNYKFSRKDNLKVHIRTHTGEIPDGARRGNIRPTARKAAAE